MYLLEAKTDKVFKVFEDPPMEPESLSVFGINGIEFRHGQLFFTNSDRNILARTLIEDDGTSSASAKVYGNFDSPDGFDFNRNGKVVIAQSEVDLLARVTGDSKVMLAGGPSNGTRPKIPPCTLPFVPTAVRLVKDSPMSLMSLGWTSRLTWTEAYIATDSGTAQHLAGNVTRGGTISMVKYQGYW